MFEWDKYYTKLLSLEAQGFSQSEIAAFIENDTGESVSRDMVRHALVRAKDTVRTLHDMPKPERIPYLTKYYDFVVGNTPAPAKNWNLRHELLKKKKAKVLVHSDLHIPFHDEEKVVDAIGKNLDADCYIVNADLMDVYDHSTFDKGMSIPFEFEIDETLRFLEYVSSTFPLVEILEANHEDRVRRTIENNLAPSLQFLANKNIMEVLARPFPNVIVHNKIWFFQQGSVVYTHPSKASRVEMKIPVEIETHLREWEDHYGLEEFNTVVIAHTHAQSIGYTAKTKLIEPGCMCRAMAYAYSPKIPYKRPQRSGYAVITLSEGVCVWDESREHSFPIEKGRF